MDEICELANAKDIKVIELDTHFKRGQKAAQTQKSTIRSCYKDKMSAADWAFTYGLHTVYNKKD